VTPIFNVTEDRFVLDPAAAFAVEDEDDLLAQADAARASAAVAAVRATRRDGLRSGDLVRLLIRGF
jgi:hypothetical protein